MTTVLPSPPPCVHCGGPVVDTVVGWTHVDHRGGWLSWLCPLPHMSLAYPAPRREPTTIPTTARHSRPPDLPDGPF
ncbi:MAG TPA: hypothetical protein VFZ32_22010 [Micromonosporaceae bacterium]